MTFGEYSFCWWWLWQSPLTTTGWMTRKHRIQDRPAASSVIVEDLARCLARRGQHFGRGNLLPLRLQYLLDRSDDVLGREAKLLK
jgi:hypothetical protein